MELLGEDWYWYKFTCQTPPGFKGGLVVETNFGADKLWIQKSDHLYQFMNY